MPTGLKCPPLINPKQELTYDAFNMEIFNNLPQFIKDKIVTSDEYKEMMNPEHVGAGGAAGGDPDDDMPF